MKLSDYIGIRENISRGEIKEKDYDFPLSAIQISL